MNSLEKNVEKCTITVKYIPLNTETASRVYEFDTTMTTKRLNEKNEEQLFDIKFLVILTCKNSKWDINLNIKKKKKKVKHRCFNFPHWTICVL